MSQVTTDKDYTIVCTVGASMSLFQPVEKSKAYSNPLCATKLVLIFL